MVSLIGISGKIGSGKDLMFHILCYLGQEDDWKNFSDYMFNAFFIHRKYENKKFAYPIKWIVSVLIGCDIRQLEDREFKEKELGEEWDGLTPRKLLQLLGTEAGRQIIHPNIWVNALFADYVCDDCGQKECPTDEEDTGQMIHRSFPNWIITDVRFPNEAKAIKDRGGIVIKLNRFSEEQKIASLKARANRPNDAIELALKEEHTSETALDDFSDFDYVIENDGSIEDLVDKVRALNLDFS